jgi:predicted NUDIX family phosphoesterase
MVRTQIQLTEEQARAIKRIANVQGVSIAEVIRRAIDRIISAGPTVDIGERHKRALEIVGKFRSARRDVSRKHDAYLAETFGK